MPKSAGISKRMDRNVPIKLVDEIATKKKGKGWVNWRRSKKAFNAIKKLAVLLSLFL